MHSSPDGKDILAGSGMAGKKKTREQLLVENRLLRRHNAGKAIASVLIELIRWAGLVGIVYVVYLIVDSLSGKQTMANIGVSFLADVKISTALSYLAGGSGVAYGWNQSRLRKSAVERLSGRIKELEKAIDPKRTSSGLTGRGETHPETL
jgi:hypothetical protein